MALLLDINKFIEENDIKYVTTANIMRAEKPDDGGLFSNVIFGLPNSRKWRTVYGAIALNVRILHPLLYEIADRRCSVLIKFMEGYVSYNEDTKSIVKNGSGQYGIPYLAEHPEDVLTGLKNTGILTDAGVKLCNYIIKHKEISFIDNMIVVSPQYRPMDTVNNKIELAPVNNYYINLINDAAVARFTKGESLKIVALRMQKNAYMVYKELMNLIKGKQGIQRNSLLSKVVDFSARAVITGDINLDPSEFGIPIPVALSLFKYHLLHEILVNNRKEFEALGERATQLNAGRVIDKIKEGSNEIPSQVKDFVIKLLNEVIKGKVIIAKRDPALHRNSMRAHYIKLVDDDTFHLHPLVCDGYNADFDGDQMCVMLPMTDKAQKIAKEDMLVGSSFSSAIGDGLSIALKKDVALGMYSLTGEYQGKDSPTPVKVSTPEEAQKAAFDGGDPGYPVIYNGKKTTAGRAIFEMIIGVPVTEQLNKKKATKIFTSLTDKMPSNKLFTAVADVTRYGCRMASLVGKSIDITNYELKPEFKKRKAEIYEKGTNISAELKALTDDIVKDFDNNQTSFLADMVKSGAESKLNNIQSSFVSKGFVADIDGSVIPTPVASSIGEGLKSAEYYTTSISGRSGLTDRAVNTQKSGYLSRQMIYALSSIKLDPTISTNRAYKPFTVFVKNDKIASGINRRMMMNGKIITDPSIYIGKSVDLISSLYWTKRELGTQCLPDFVYKNLKSKNIGIIAAQSIGERASQLTMSTFHMTSSSGFANFLAVDKDLERICIQDKDGNITSKCPIIVRVDRQEITDMSGGEYIFQNFTIESDTLKIELSLDYDFTLLINDPNDVTVNNGIYTIPYGEGVIFGSMKNSAGSVSGAVESMQKMLGNRTFVNQDSLTLKLFNYLDGIPMWACELVVSQLFRDPDNPSIPYRCSSRKKEPLRIGFKKIAVNESWRRGAAFENVSEALTTSVLNDNDKSEVDSDYNIIANL